MSAAFESEGQLVARDPAHKDDPSHPTASLDTVSVHLHTFCPSCQKFLDSWDVLDSMQNHKEVEESKWQPSFLCTMASLREPQYQDCHFCKLVLSCWYRVPYRVPDPPADGNVYIHVQGGSDTRYCYAFCGHEVPVLSKNTGRRSEHVLKTYNCQFEAFR